MSLNNHNSHAPLSTKKPDTLVVSVDYDSAGFEYRSKVMVMTRTRLNLLYFMSFVISFLFHLYIFIGDRAISLALSITLFVLSVVFVYMLFECTDWVLVSMCKGQFIF